MAACSECPVCDRPATRASAAEAASIPCNVRRFAAEAFTLWRCAGCGSLHCAEDADLPRYYADYPLQRQRLTLHERIGYRNRRRWLAQRGVGAGARILDYGCGAGLFVAWLRRHGHPRAAGYDAFVPAYADARVLEPAAYDAVVSYDVIEHDDDPRRFLRELAALVRPGGLLTIGTPNADHLSLARARDPALHPPYHRHILSEAALTGLAREIGLVPERIRRRSYFDSWVPTVNFRFMSGYIEASGGHLDAAVEPPRPGVVWRSPRLVGLALLGGALPHRGHLVADFRKPG